MKQSASSREALAIDPQYSVLLALLVGLGILGWPILKFFVLAPQERFKFVDFILLLLSTSATVGFVFVLFLCGESYSRLYRCDNQRLKLLAAQLKSDFETEVKTMRAQLSLFDAAAASKLEPLDCERMFQINQVFEAERAKVFGLPEDPSRWPYPSFISVFWARGRDGRQIGKVTALAANTPQVSVAARNYFQEVRNGHLWDLKSDFAVEPERRKPFFIQTYRSITTGDFETALSMGSQTACHPMLREGNVAVITTLLQSFRPRPLPPDLGFVVIDRSGLVLFHSDQKARASRGRFRRNRGLWIITRDCAEWPSRVLDHILQGCST